MTSSHTTSSLKAMIESANVAALAAIHDPRCAIVSALNNRVSRKSNGAKLLALPVVGGVRP